MAHLAERVSVWFRRRQGAVRVVDCQCRRIEVVQIPLVRLVKPLQNWVNFVAEPKKIVAWKLVKIGV